MVSTTFQVEPIDSLWSIVQIVVGFGTVACLCCVLFLGLKLKWFRAQFKVQDTPNTKKPSDTVQGIGFKVKTNSDDYQRYKSISEFAIPATVSGVPLPDNKNETILNEIKLKTFQKVELKNKEVKSENKETQSSINLSKVEIKNKEVKSENNETQSINLSKAKKTKTKEKVRTKSKVLKSENEEGQPINLSETKTKEKVRIKSKVVKSENKDTQPINLSKANETKTNESQLQENKVKRVGFVKNNTIINEENSIMQQEMKNPISTQADEDNWQVKITGETSKVQIDHRNDEIYYEEIHLANNSSSSMISNSMYSSQAASIFFGSYDENEKQPPDSPPPPIPRKFLEHVDNISISSQTSA